MYKAAEGGHLQIVKLLLSRGAEVDSKDKVSTYVRMLMLLINRSRHLHSHATLPMSFSDPTASVLVFVAFQG